MAAELANSSAAAASGRASAAMRRGSCSWVVALFIFALSGADAIALTPSSWRTTPTTARARAPLVAMAATLDADVVGTEAVNDADGDPDGEACEPVVEGTDVGCDVADPSRFPAGPLRAGRHDVALRGAHVPDLALRGGAALPRRALPAAVCGQLGHRGGEPRAHAARREAARHAHPARPHVHQVRPAAEHPGRRGAGRGDRRARAAAERGAAVPDAAGEGGDPPLARAAARGDLRGV